MTEQERQLISGLGERIRNAPAPQIDRDAYDLILHTIGTRPDALYILTQTVLIQEMAVNQAKAQIEELKRQAEGYSGASQQGVPQQGVPQQGVPQQGVPQQSGFMPGAYQSSSYATQAPPPPPPPSGGGFSGFLHNAAQTAAGVIAGEIAFDTISSLFGHHGGGFFGGGGGFFGGGGGGISPGSETIVNNYYGDGDPGGSGKFGDGQDSDSRFAQAADQDQNISPDIDDERDNSGDNFSSDDSSSDDSSSDGGDDSGSSDV
jgi:hypothetical protein